MENNLNEYPLLNPGVVYSSEQACKILKICKKSLQTLRDQGQISYSKIGGRILFTFDDLTDVLSNNRRQRFA
jgi:hypothetical protein